MVRDTDGSAFITKAEFDSLKNNFQAQIDNYNTSIDSKIDGAIAAYLAGIQLSTAEIKRVICYDNGGIYSVVENDTNVQWKEGMMRFGAVLGTLGHYPRFDPQYSADTWPGKYCCWSITMGSGVPFISTALNNVNSARTNGLWGGVISNYQALIISQVKDSEASLSATDASLANRKVGLYNWPSITNKNIALNPSLIVVELGWGASWTDFQQEYFDPNFTSLTRESNGPATYKNIILTPNSISYKRFENFDLVTDFYNDPDDIGHTKSVDFYSATPGVGSKIELHYKRYSIESQYYLGYQNWDTVKDPGNHKRPYIGFINTITDWNKIATANYDSELSTIKTYNPTTSKYIWKDDSNTEHLYLSAGAPIVEIKKDQVLDMDIDFQDTSKNYRIYLHDGPFDNNVGMASHTGLYSNTEMNIANGSSYYGTIINGHGHIKLRAKSDNVLFIKWTIGDTNDNGGGTFLPPQNCTVTQDN